MQPGKLGVWVSTNSLSQQRLAELAQGVERLGYDVLWYPESLAYESLALGGFLLGQTTKLRIASGIANIYARDPLTARAGHDTLNSLYNDRYIFGLGVSHVPLVEGQRGHSYQKPVATMRAYLQAMRDANVDIDVPAQNVVLAALGPNMLALSRDMSQGAHPYCVTPEHTKLAADILGPDKWLCVEQKVCLTTDKSKWRAVAAKQLARYMRLDNYRNNWLRIGFTEDEFTGEPSERFLDAMCAWGTADDIRARIKAHEDAGATHVCIQAFDPDGGVDPHWDALQALALA
jgi:probable F420-dependent oxidoreductase